MEGAASTAQREKIATVSYGPGGDAGGRVESMASWQETIDIPNLVAQEKDCHHRKQKAGVSIFSVGLAFLSPEQAISKSLFGARFEVLYG